MGAGILSAFTFCGRFLGSQDGLRFEAVPFSGPPICIARLCETSVPDGLGASCGITRPYSYFDAGATMVFCLSFCEIYIACLLYVCFNPQLWLKHPAVLPTGAYQGERRRVHEASGPL